VLCLVTDARRFPQPSTVALLDRIEAAVRAGVSLVQIRERLLPDREVFDLAGRAVARTAGSGAAVVVNERFDIALAAGAAGVHLRGDSVAASRVRDATPDEFIIGRSVHSLREAEAVTADGGCDYLLFGTVYPTASKPPGHPVAGIAALEEICRRIPLPVLAIGGIDASNARAVAAAGAAGIAAVGAFMTDEPSTVAERVAAMRAAFDS
jgi:thiamine-phosphate pyrophosphorylase